MDVGKKGNNGVFAVSEAAAEPLKMASAALTALCSEAGVSFVAAVALRSSENGEEDTAVSYNIEYGKVTDTVSLFRMITMLTPENREELHIRAMRMLETQNTASDVLEKMKRFMKPQPHKANEKGLA